MSFLVETIDFVVQSCLRLFSIETYCRKKGQLEINTILGLSELYTPLFFSGPSQTVDIILTPVWDNLVKQVFNNWPMCCPVRV